MSFVQLYTELRFTWEDDETVSDVSRKLRRFTKRVVAVEETARKHADLPNGLTRELPSVLSFVSLLYCIMARGNTLEKHLAEMVQDYSSSAGELVQVGIDSWNKPDPISKQDVFDLMFFYTKRYPWIPDMPALSNIVSIGALLFFSYILNSRKYCKAFLTSGGMERLLEIKMDDNNVGLIAHTIVSTLPQDLSPISMEDFLGLPHKVLFQITDTLIWMTSLPILTAREGACNALSFLMSCSELRERFEAKGGLPFLMHMLRSLLVSSVEDDLVSTVILTALHCLRSYIIAKMLEVDEGSRNVPNSGQSDASRQHRRSRFKATELYDTWEGLQRYQEKQSIRGRMRTIRAFFKADQTVDWLNALRRCGDDVFDLLLSIANQSIDLDCADHAIFCLQAMANDPRY